MEIIKVENLNFSFENPVLKNVNFTVRKGEWLCIFGQNGSGKTTLSKLLVGLLEKKSGSIKVNNEELSQENIFEIRKKIGIVFQNPDNQFVGSTVEDDIAFGLENYGVPRDEMKKRVEYFSKKVRMKNFLQHEPHTLSGGQKQRVAIASVLAQHPEIIIFDESTSMLDPEGVKEVYDLINELYLNENITIISITHNMEEAMLSDRILVLNKGEVHFLDTPDNIFEKNNLEDIGLKTPYLYEIYHQLKKKNPNLKFNKDLKEMLK